MSRFLPSAAARQPRRRAVVYTPGGPDGGPLRFQKDPETEQDVHNRLVEDYPLLRFVEALRLGVRGLARKLGKGGDNEI